MRSHSHPQRMNESRQYPHLYVQACKFDHEQEEKLTQRENEQMKHK